MNDPYLTNIGHWLNKDYLKAVNLLSSEKEDDCLIYMFKNASIEFNLCPHLERPPKELDETRAPKGSNFVQFDNEEEV